jgi:hypothetical protein
MIGLATDAGMSSMATQWAATNELERSLNHRKPVVAETWVVPTTHQLERRRTVVEALQTTRGFDVL